MIDTLLEQLETLVGSDDFEFESEEIMERLEEEGAGFEIVEKLFAIMERHPLDDFGMPGAVVHFIERFYPSFLPLLTASVDRAPSLHTVWMLNRCINGTNDKEKLISLLRKTADDPAVDKAIRDLAGSFLDHQSGT
jgi:hypothetical protein